MGSGMEQKQEAREELMGTNLEGEALLGRFWVWQSRGGFSGLLALPGFSPSLEA